jgi:hypothetical protein
MVKGVLANVWPIKRPTSGNRPSPREEHKCLSLLFYTVDTTAPTMRTRTARTRVDHGLNRRSQRAFLQETYSADTHSWRDDCLRERLVPVEMHCGLDASRRQNNHKQRQIRGSRMSGRSHKFDRRSTRSDQTYRRYSRPLQSAFIVKDEHLGYCRILPLQMQSSRSVLALATRLSDPNLSQQYDSLGRRLRRHENVRPSITRVTQISVRQAG